MSASARRNDIISIAPLLVRLSRILHNIGTATAVLALPVPPPLYAVRVYSSALNSSAMDLSAIGVGIAVLVGKCIQGPCSAVPDIQSIR